MKGVYKVQLGFVEQQAEKLVKGKRTAGFSLLVMGLALIALAMFMYSYTSNDPANADYAGMMAGMFGVPAVILCLVSIPQFLKASKVKNQTEVYSHLKVLSDNQDEYKVASIINDEIAQGKIQIEIQPFKYAKDVKVILLPSYLLFCQHEITAVPIDKVYWIYTCEADKDMYINKKTVSIKGYATGILYDKKKYYIVADCKADAEEITARFHKYIPNVLGQYDNGLEKLFDKNHAEFLRIYNECKENFHGSQNV